VLPANRALKLLLAGGKTHATSRAEAITVARELGVDGVLVGAITEYKPYKPQKVGLILQLYWVRADMTTKAVEPIGLARRASPVRADYYTADGPGTQVQAVLDASRNDVTAKVATYARQHRGQDSPFGWRKYLVDSDAYMHFVCHEMIAQLLEEELRRITVPMRVK